jgi:hypothetical protein
LRVVTRVRQDSLPSPVVHELATHESGLLALLWASRRDPDTTTHSTEWALPPASSARSVFGTRQGRPPRSAPVAPLGLAPGASLSTCCPACRDNLRIGRCGSAASPAPAGRPYHARGSLLAEPANATPPFATLSRVWHRVIGDSAVPPRRRDVKNGLRSPARRSPPHRPASGTPSLYYDNATMSSSVSWSAIRAPARLTAMGPREQDNKCY